MLLGGRAGWTLEFFQSPNQSEVLQMMLGVYATLGIFLLLASRNPSANHSLIAFAAWSSLVHAAIMAVRALHDVSERGHLLGGVFLFVIVGVLLLVLASKAEGGCVLTGGPLSAVFERPSETTSPPAPILASTG